MKILRFFSALTVATGLLLLVSCEYEFIETPAPPVTTDTISFSSDVAPIFSDDACTACHNGGIAFDLTADNAYNNIVSNNLVVPSDPENSKIWYYPEPANGQHNSKYSVSNANTIYSWISQGALDN
ncbi:MAG: hypothetical protein JW731_06885 [Bacteroidales bacterium]|nr:hypothetical protein [Bacteroidales bacterium]